MGNPMLVRRVLNRFLDQVRIDVDSIVTAIAGQDVIESIRLAHKVRGTALSVSAREMSRIAHAIEMLAETANKTDLLALAVSLSKEQSRIINFLDSICIESKDA